MHQGAFCRLCNEKTHAGACAADSAADKKLDLQQARVLAEQKLSLAKVAEISKKCAKSHVPIEKNAGCGSEFF